MQKSDIVSALQSNICDVKFTKVNGEERLMRCTLKEDLLPDSVKSQLQQQDEAHEQPAFKDNVVPVWDLEKEGWRSFRIDSVIDIQTVML
jgi:hypothetical protein|tara:strand:+ start:142 stop:411 length:270 start_codon:yes stop_codon:yes gene_type:complete